MLAEAEVDLAGVKAEIAAARKQRDQIDHRTASRAVTATLNEMLVTLDVKLAGVLARQEAAIKGRTDAQVFRELLKSERKTKSALMAASTALERSRASLKQTKERLARVDAMEKLVAVKDNKVTIKANVTVPASLFGDEEDEMP